MSLFRSRKKADLWSEYGRKRWPRDRVGWTFLGRAIDRVGKARYPEDWSDRDPGIDLEAIASGLLRFGGLSQDRAARFGENVAEYDRVTKPYRPADERAADIIGLLAKRLEAGQIPAATSDDQTGEMMPCEPHWWSADDLRPRFRSCQLDRQQPAAPLGAGSWIFIATDAVEKLERQVVAARREHKAEPPRQQPKDETLKEWAEGQADAGAIVRDISKASLREQWPGNVRPKITDARKALSEAYIRRGKPVTQGRPRGKCEPET